VKTELMIFLTPTIVPNPSTVGELTGVELRNTELVEKAFSENEFEKFFDGRDQRFAPSSDIPPMEDPAPKKTQVIEQEKVRTPPNLGAQRTNPVSVKTTTTVKKTTAPAKKP
jgi:hypothetical protein